MQTGPPAEYADSIISSHEQLNQHYGEPAAASLMKELDYISAHYRVFIERSPFAVLATSGTGGLDCSPRGDPPGFCRVADKHTLMLPDRRGNNRLDSLRNLVEDSRASLLFLIPGIGETMRLNGNAYVVTDPALCNSFVINGKIPASVIVFKVQRIYFQCQKALARSGLWKPESRVERSELPSIGEWLQSVSADFDGRQYDLDYPERLKKTIY